MVDETVSYSLTHLAYEYETRLERPIDQEIAWAACMRNTPNTVDPAEPRTTNRNGLPISRKHSHSDACRVQTRSTYLSSARKAIQHSNRTPRADPSQYDILAPRKVNRRLKSHMIDSSRRFRKYWIRSQNTQKLDKENGTDIGDDHPPSKQEQQDGHSAVKEEASRMSGCKNYVQDVTLKVPNPEAILPSNYTVSYLGVGADVFGNNTLASLGQSTLDIVHEDNSIAELNLAPISSPSVSLPQSSLVCKICSLVYCTANHNRASELGFSKLLQQKTKRLFSDRRTDVHMIDSPKISSAYVGLRGGASSPHGSDSEDSLINGNHNTSDQSLSDQDSLYRLDIRGVPRNESDNASYEHTNGNASAPGDSSHHRPQNSTSVNGLNGDTNRDTLSGQHVGRHMPVNGVPIDGSNGTNDNGVPAPQGYTPDYNLNGLINGNPLWPQYWESHTPENGVPVDGSNRSFFNGAPGNSSVMTYEDLHRPLSNNWIHFNGSDQLYYNGTPIPQRYMADYNLNGHVNGNGSYQPYHNGGNATLQNPISDDALGPRINGVNGVNGIDGVPNGPPSSRRSSFISYRSRVDSLRDPQQEEDDYVIDWWLCEPLGRTPSNGSYSSSVDSLIEHQYLGRHRSSNEYDPAIGYDRQDNIGSTLFPPPPNSLLSRVPYLDPGPASNIWPPNPGPPDLPSRHASGHASGLATGPPANAGTTDAPPAGTRRRRDRILARLRETWADVRRAGSQFGDVFKRR
jgi:hypothetical protein